jgi:hypothetical protein
LERTPGGKRILIVHRADNTEFGKFGYGISEREENSGIVEAGDHRTVNTWQVWNGIPSEKRVFTVASDIGQRSSPAVLASSEGSEREETRAGVIASWSSYSGIYYLFVFCLFICYDRKRVR